MPDTVIRPRNALAMFKLEVTEGVNPSPDVVDAFPYEVDSLSWTSPWREEDSGESTGTLEAGAPLIIGQPSTVRFTARIKGAGASVVYTASVKPPHHALLQACGWRGQFTAAVAATALAAGTTTSATLATPFAATANQYVGQRLILTGVAAGAHPLISDYTAGRLATLTDVFGVALASTSSAALNANWTYAMTSPADVAARATDHPSGTFRYVEDGIEMVWTGCRGKVKISASDAKPGYFDFELTGVFAGRAPVAVPSGAVLASQAAPMLVQGSAISMAFGINRKPLPISAFEFDPQATLDSAEDPNTMFGFRSGEIGDRASRLTCDPLTTQLSVRDHLAEIGDGIAKTAAVRAGATTGNRWSLMVPHLYSTAADPGKRGQYRSESLAYRAINPGDDAYSRDRTAILCFD